MIQKTMEMNDRSNLLKGFFVCVIVFLSVSVVLATGYPHQPREGPTCEDESYTWSSGDPYDLILFVNTQGYSLRSDTALYYDDTTAQKFCNLAGFNTVDSYDCVSIHDGRCGWYSPHDNYLAKWNPPKNKFDVLNAKTCGYNQWIATISCSDPIDFCGSTQCNDDVDNDNDQVIDAADPGCWDDPDDPTTYNPDLDDESKKDPECRFNSDCDSQDYESNPYCGLDGSVYKDVHDFRCGSAYTCIETITTEKVETCNDGCSNGVCNDPEPPQTPVCSDTLDNDGDGKIDLNDPGCDNNPNGTTEIDCFVHTDCGINIFLPGTNTCKNGNVFANHSYYLCMYKATNQAYCSFSIFNQLKESCSGGSCTSSVEFCSGGDVYVNETCMTNTCSYGACQAGTPDVTQTKVEDCAYGCANGSCKDVPPVCSYSSDCGNRTEQLVCRGDDVVNKITNPLCSGNACSINISEVFVKECKNGCLNGRCKSDNDDDDNDDRCTSCDNDPIIIYSTPLLNAGNKTLDVSDVFFPQKSIAVNEKFASFNWNIFFVILLIGGIFLLIVLIVFFGFL